MTAYRNEAAGGRPLGNLGISEPEETTYRWLLKHRGASASEAAKALSLAPDKARRLLEALGDKGLATHTPERPQRYVPASPDVALEAMILQRQKGLQDARLVAQELQCEAATDQRDAPIRVVELITSREAEGQILRQMEASAQEEFATMTRPPFRVVPPGEDAAQEHSEQRKAQARGVYYRSIVGVDFFDSPGAMDGIRADLRTGEDVRAIASLPLKAVIADRRVALIPLSLRREDSPTLLVRSSTLLDALYALFELLWERASPISFLKDGELELDSPKSWRNEQAGELITLMAAGLNDKNISHQLGVTTRTLQRYVTASMAELGARTRFQLGWLAALRLVAEGAIPAGAPRRKDLGRCPICDIS